MTEQEYNLAEGIRRSDLWRMHDSPEKYKFFLDHPQEESSPALTFGSAAHKMVLEPDTFFDEYAVAPACDRRTKEGKALYETFLEQSEGKTIISAEDLKTVQEIFNNRITDTVKLHVGIILCLEILICLLNAEHLECINVFGIYGRLFGKIKRGR